MGQLFNGLEDVKIKNTQNGSNKIGLGAYSDVLLITHKNNPDKKYAMKQIDVKNAKRKLQITKEIQMHKDLKHPNIINFVDYFESEDKVYIILEYAENGDMFGYIQNNKSNEKELLKFFYQTCQAIDYLHSKNILHRDLKPENILIDSNNNVKLCDFGWSTIYDERFIRTTICGTFEYMAPEILFNKPQSTKTDIWSLGILLYEMFHNRAPYEGSRMDEMMDAIIQKKIVYKKSLNENIKKLISSILVLKFDDRPSIEQILENVIFDKFRKQSVKNISNENSDLFPSQYFRKISHSDKNLDFKFTSDTKNNHKVYQSNRAYKNFSHNVYQNYKQYPKNKNSNSNLKYQNRSYTPQIQTTKKISNDSINIDETKRKTSTQYIHNVYSQKNHQKRNFPKIQTYNQNNSLNLVKINSQNSTSNYVNQNIQRKLSNTYQNLNRLQPLHYRDYTPIKQLNKNSNQHILQRPIYSSYQQKSNTQNQNQQMFLKEYQSKNIKKFNPMYQFSKTQNLNTRKQFIKQFKYQNQVNKIYYFYFSSIEVKKTDLLFKDFLLTNFFGTASFALYDTYCFFLSSLAKELNFSTGQSLNYEKTVYVLDYEINSINSLS